MTQYCPHLQHISLVGGNAQRLTSIVFLLLAERLREYQIHARESHLYGLRYFKFTGSMGGMSNMDIQVLAHLCPELRYLDLGSGSQSMDSGVQALAHHCPQLEHLTLGHASVISDVGMNALAQCCPALHEVSLSLDAHEMRQQRCTLPGSKWETITTFVHVKEIDVF